MFEDTPVNIPLYEPTVMPVAITKPLAHTGIPDASGIIAHCARVSSSKELNDRYKDASGLMAYCLANHHISIFQMVHLVIEIKTTRDIGRQILRHRSFEFQEFSQRYPEAALIDADRQCRMQDAKNRQNSIPTDEADVVLWWSGLQADIANFTNHVYGEAIDRGIAKEVARAVLPEGLTETHMYMAGSIRSWITYCAIRAFGPGVQAEHREIALRVWDVLVSQIPFLKDYQGLVEAMGRPHDR